MLRSWWYLLPGDNGVPLNSWGKSCETWSELKLRSPTMTAMRLGRVPLRAAQRLSQSAMYPSKRARRHKCTRTHDFFACTGGFAFELPEEAFSDLSGSTNSFLPPDCPRRLTLTARGVALLAKCGHLPDIPEEEILDKSKANNLAKAMVVIQAIWMLLQVGGRLVEKLPVTLLEVNTVAHVLCALLMYAMWWHKPLLPQEPMILTGDWIDPLCAYMYVCSELSGRVEEKSMEAQTAVKSMFASLKLYSKSPEVENLCLSLAPADSFRDGDVTQYKMSEMSDQRCLDRLNEQRARKASDTAFFERRPRVVSTASTATIQSPSKIRRLELAAAAMSRYEALKTPETSYTHCLDTNMCYHPLTAEYVAPRVMNWPYDHLLRNVNGLTVGLLLWLSNFCYGALHTAAWNDHFPTDAEKWLWRCSSVYISFCGALWIFVNWIAQAYKPLNDFWENWVDGKKALWHNVLLGACAVICGTAFGLARFYIVVEAFVSIRHLPLEAYATPSWTQVLPHL